MYSVYDQYQDLEGPSSTTQQALVAAREYAVFPGDFGARSPELEGILLYYYLKLLCVLAVIF